MFSSGDGNETAARASSGPRETLNAFLNQCQIQPLGRPWTDWDIVNEKTRRSEIRDLVKLLRQFLGSFARSMRPKFGTRYRFPVS